MAVSSSVCLGVFCNAENGPSSYRAFTPSPEYLEEVGSSALPLLLLARLLKQHFFRFT